MLVVTRSGFVPWREPAPAQSALALQVVLQRPQRADGLVHGVVLYADGGRVAGAQVSADQKIAATDQNGEFTLDVEQEDTRPRLLALLPGVLPAVFEPERDAAGHRSGRPTSCSASAHRPA